MARILGLPLTNLTLEDLPDGVRRLYQQFVEARSRAADLGAQLDKLAWGDTSRKGLGEQHEASLAELAEAHARLSNATIEHGRAIHDYAVVQYMAHVARVHDLLVEGERELLAAAGSARLAAVAASRPGRPILTDGGTAGDRSAGRLEAMNAVSMLRDVLARLPEGLD